MIRRLAFVLLFAAVFCANTAQSEPTVEVYFEHCTDAVVRELSHAKQTIHVQAYSFTSAPIARALTDAEERDVKVIAILDASNRTRNYSAADLLAHEGIETYIDSRHAIAHNKIIVIDGATVLTGSFNFTDQSEEQNEENLLIIRDKPKLFAAYLGHFEEHLRHSDAPRQGKED